MTSVAARSPASTAARLASRLSSVITATASSNHSPVALWRLLSTPRPSGLVSVSGIPTCAASLRSSRSGSARPVTARPYFGSGSSMLCPPARNAPASAHASAPPRSTSAASVEGDPVARPAEQVDRDHRGAPHRLDVRQRVGGGDAPEGVGVVDDRGEEVGGGDDGPAGAVGGGSMRTAAASSPWSRPTSRSPDARPRPSPRQHAFELAGRHLARAPAAGGVLGEADRRLGRCSRACSPAQCRQPAGVRSHPVARGGARDARLVSRRARGRLRDRRLAGPVPAGARPRRARGPRGRRREPGHSSSTCGR